MADISENLALVHTQIAAAAQKAGRGVDSVRLIAVSKVKPVSAVKEALAAGQRVFGENRVQEAAEKFPELRAAYPDIELHLIGGLQTNKVAEAVRLFDVIQTLDRPKLAAALSKEIKRQRKAPRLYIQVNIGAEEQKSGVSVDEVESFYKLCQDNYHLEIAGLMCLPPKGQNPAPFFAQLADIAKGLDLPHISMGMSSDYEQAIAAGTTEVRIGTAIFGER